MPHFETPRNLGCRWPAEWEPHAATWVSWPHRERTWPGHFQPIPGRFATLIQTLAEYEPVHVLAGGHEVMAQARSMVGGLAHVTLHDIATNDAWARDYGPTFLLGPGASEVSLLDWRFNAWGGKYSAWDLDDAVPRQIADRLQLRRFEPGIVLEGGSIDTDGQGTILTTQSCLLDLGRNPGLNVRQIESVLQEFCAASRVIWLPGGPLGGDDTDGHVDQLARFVQPHQIVVAVEQNPHDVNYAPLQANLRRLESWQQEASDVAREVIPLPMPQPVLIDNQRVPASYCNFYIANNCVVVPQFEVPADETACEILQRLFPDRRVLGLPARDLIWGLGAFHCLTQQQPA
jgi:agmatine deiminase